LLSSSDENTQNTTPIGTLRNKQATLDLEEFFKQVAQFNAKIENLRKASNNLKKEINILCRFYFSFD
jgi:hypothetical protein